MTKLSLPVFLVVFALFCGVSASTVQLMAQDQSAPPSAPIAQSEKQGEGQAQPAAKGIAGKIVKEADRFVLKDAVANQTYQLDDQARAKKFEGQDVVVTGSVDAVTNTIKVESIKKAAVN